MTPLSAALAYAKRGWYVIPLHTPTSNGGCSCGNDCGRIGKHPRVKGWTTDPRPSEETIKRWWSSWPDANVAIRAGAESGFIALDIDPRHGGDSNLLELEAKYGKIPDTIEAKTGGGGRHALFEHPGRQIKCRTGEQAFLDGVELKGDGGFIVVAPSLHPSGRRYEWDAGYGLDTPIAKPPAWLLESYQSSGTSSAADEGPIPEGQRVTVMCKYAGAMRRRGMGKSEILAALVEANKRCINKAGRSEGLPLAKLEDIATSYARYKPGDPAMYQREPGDDEEEHGKENALLEIHYVNPPDPRVEKPPAFIDGLAFQGYTIASGPPKLSKKTWFFIAESLSIHTGIPFLGRSVNQAKCAWIQLDMAEWDFQDYCDRIARGMRIPESRMPYLFCSALDLKNSEQWRPIGQRLKELETQILYIDSCRAVSNVDENDSAEVKKIVRGFFCGYLRNETEISTVLIAHTPKGAAGARGSGEWTGGADCDLRFQPPEDGKTGPIKIVGIGRHADLEINFEFEDFGLDGVAIRALTSEEFWKKRQFSPDQFETAHKYVLEHASGVTQSAIMAELKYRGLSIHGRHARTFLDAVRERYHDLAERSGPRTSRIFFVQESTGSTPNWNRSGDIIEESISK